MGCRDWMTKIAIKFNEVKKSAYFNVKWGNRPTYFYGIAAKIWWDENSMHLMKNLETESRKVCFFLQKSIISYLGHYRIHRHNKFPT